MFGYRFADENMRLDMRWRCVNRVGLRGRAAAHDPSRPEEDDMFYIGDLFQWDRFITPSIIKIFYWLVVIITVMVGLSGLVSALGMMAISPIPGLIMVIVNLAGMFVGIIFARIAAEFVLIVFRINEHLGAIRNRGDM
jgi:hypothetical protein